MTPVPFFSNNQEIAIYRYTETGEYDDDGEPEYIYKKQSTVTGDVQPTQSSDVNQETGEAQTNTYKIYVTSGTDCLEEDLIVFDGVYCKVTGRPENWNHGLVSHMEIPCKELRTIPTLTDHFYGVITVETEDSKTVEGATVTLTNNSSTYENTTNSIGICAIELPSETSEYYVTVKSNTTRAQDSSKLYIGKIVNDFKYTVTLKVNEWEQKITFIDQETSEPITDSQVVIQTTTGHTFYTTDENGTVTFPADKNTEYTIYITYNTESKRVYNGYFANYTSNKTIEVKP